MKRWSHTMSSGSKSFRKSYRSELEAVYRSANRARQTSTLRSKQRYWSLKSMKSMKIILQIKKPNSFSMLKIYQVLPRLKGTKVPSMRALRWMTWRVTMYPLTKRPPAPSRAHSLLTCSKEYHPEDFTCGGNHSLQSSASN